MAIVSLIQLLLMIFAVRVKCTDEILRPMDKPNIQPVSVRTKYYPDTSTTLYSVIFYGPSDTVEKSGTPLTEVWSKEYTSVFKAKIKLNALLKEKYLRLSSASTKEEFTLLLPRRERTDIQDTFPGRDCGFELKKETDGRITSYSVRKEGNCDTEDSRSFFKIKLEDSSQRTFTESIPEQYLNKTETQLTLNEERMKNDGFQLNDAYFQSEVMLEMSTNLIFSYNWKVDLI